MIGRITGVLIEKHPPFLLLDVHGIGYEIEATMTTFYKLPEVGHEVSLHTHLLVREDAHLLYGFHSSAERQLFRTLLKVNGVGAKLALTILSGMEAEVFARCVQDSDTAALVRLPGVGKKTAERLIIEMRDRLNDWQPEATLPGSAPVMGRAMPADPVSDAISALVALGYKPQEASKHVHAMETEGMDSEEIIRMALKSALR